MLAASTARLTQILTLPLRQILFLKSYKLGDIGEAMIEHAKLDLTPAELQEKAEREGLTRLY